MTKDSFYNALQVGYSTQTLPDDGHSKLHNFRRNEKRGCSSAGGLGIKGPSPRMTPRSSSASDRRSSNSMALPTAGIPPSLPHLRQEAADVAGERMKNILQSANGQLTA